MSKRFILIAPVWLSLSTAGCSLVFAPSGYPQDRDAAVDPQVDAWATVTTDAPSSDASVRDAGPVIRTAWPSCDGRDPATPAGDVHGAPIELGSAQSAWLGEASRVSAFGLLADDFALPGVDVRAVALAADGDTSSATNDRLYAAVLTPGRDGTVLTVFEVRVDVADTRASTPLFDYSYSGEPLDVAISENSGALEVLVVTTLAPHLIRFSTSRDVTPGPTIPFAGSPLFAAYANEVPVVASGRGVFRINGTVTQQIFVFDRVPLLVGSVGNRVYTRRDASAVGVDMDGNNAMFSSRTVVGTGTRDFPLSESTGTYGLRAQTFAGTLASAHAAPDHRQNDFIVVGASQPAGSEVRVMTVLTDDSLGPSFVMGTGAAEAIDLEMAVTSNAYGVGVFALTVSNGGARLNGFRVCAASP